MGKTIEIDSFYHRFPIPTLPAKNPGIHFNARYKKKKLTKSKLIPISKIVLANISTNLKQKIAVDLIQMFK
jgi:hypothetical protein